jgi:L-alanine-DL-glutamate epimerase-like enolase superfamily enzyme
LDSIDVIKEKVREADDDGATILKVKLGSDHDKEIIEAIRLVSDTEIWVDANEGWKTLDQARDMVQFLGDKNVTMIEQPMPASEFELMKLLKPLSQIPLIADESFTGKQSLAELVEGFHGINIKLMKVGSLRKAHQIIDDAKSVGLKIMIGCMIETAIANTAGALLSLRADFADLDGWKLLSDRPFDGMKFGEGNRIVLNDLPGLGVTADTQ